MFWVYMLECSDGSLYTGHTENLELRIGQHEIGADPNCYTFTKRPVTLAYSQEFATGEEALNMERRVKGWSRAKKKALIGGDWQEIARLSNLKNRNSVLR